MLNKVLVILFFHLLFFSPLGHANFDKAMKIYSTGNFNEAKIAFEALAAIGDRPSLFNLGVMYYRGEAVAQNPVKAYVLMKIANDGLDDEYFTRIANSISKKFDDAKKKTAEELFVKMDPIYNISTIEHNIFPKPLDDKDCPPEVKPISKKHPKYPRSESFKGRMGLVKVEFTISPQGYPRDVIVSKSTSNAFSNATVKAVRTFLYEPPLDGKPIYGHRTNFTYHLEGIEEVKTKKLTKELNELKDSAKSGDVVAQYRYASSLNTFRYFKKYLEKVDLQYKTANEWFKKSAENGLPHAQYEIGRNMIQGRGCEVDVINGYKWINAAAVSGYSPAQTKLALSALSMVDIASDKSLAAIGWLRNAAQSNDFAAKLLLAWELSTSEMESVRNGERALELLKLAPVRYFDKLRIMETKAAAYAELGDFKNAIKMQKKAAKIAKKLDWNIALIPQRLSLYNLNEPYRGSYY